MFDQKGLFKTDVSIHHALLTASLSSYCSAILTDPNANPNPSLDGSSQAGPSSSASATQLPELRAAVEIPGNEWGFAHMAEHIGDAARLQPSHETVRGCDVQAFELPSLQVCLLIWVEGFSHERADCAMLRALRYWMLTSLLVYLLGCPQLWNTQHPLALLQATF